VAVRLGYDNAYLKERRHPTRTDLDRVSRKIPIALYHFSGHVVALNSKALEVMGFDSRSVAPEGGVIARMRGSDEPNGVLEEQAMLPVVMKLLRSTSGSELLTLLDRSREVYKANGFTTVVEAAATPDQVRTLKAYSAAGRLDIDVIAFVLAVTQGAEATAAQFSRRYANRFRVGGGKVNLDGGSPGRTAYLREPYYRQAEGAALDYRGYSSIRKQEHIDQLVAGFYELGVPIYIHALGDAAVDQAIHSVGSAEAKFPRDDIRTQLIHLQLLHEDQMEALKRLDATLTFQITHNFYFADFRHEQTFGPERTAKLNPMKSALDRGLSVTFHHDSPVHPVNQMDLIWIATNRSSRSGRVYGPEERLTPYQALRASTLESAWQFFEEDRKGSLVIGKLADLVILSANPLKVDLEKIKDIQILETIKEGRSIFRRVSSAASL